MEKYIYELYAGMSGDDTEIVITNAPLEIMEEQLRILCKQEELGEVEENVYRYLEENGYIIYKSEIKYDLINNSDLEEDDITYRLDWCDYYED